MTPTAVDPIASLLAKSAQVLANAADAMGTAGAHGSQVVEQMQKVAHQADNVAQFGLLPLCLALLILHEFYRSAQEGSAFRVTRVLLSAGAVVGLVLAYSKVCGLITSVAGAGSGWMGTTNYLDFYDHGTDSLGTAWNNLGGLSNLPKFVGIVIVWAVLMMSVLFAYVAGALLSVVQAVTLSLLLGLGKTCIVVSLVPGVALGKSWARALAQVAAWSTVAGVILGLLSAQSIKIEDLIANGDFVPLLKASAHFIILALLTLAVPLITAKLFSGAAAGLTEVAAGFVAARGIASRGMNALRGRGEAGSSGGQSSGDNGKSRRPHKIPHGNSDEGGSSQARRSHKSPRPSDDEVSQAPTGRYGAQREPSAPHAPIVDAAAFITVPPIECDEEAETLR